MDARKNIKQIWEYIADLYDTEAIEGMVEEFQFDTNRVSPSNLNKLSDEDANSLLFRLNYMVLNGLFGGDFYTWYEVLRYSLDFDEETIDFLDY